MKCKILTVLVLAALMLAAPQLSFGEPDEGEPAAGEQIDWQVISSGGNESSSSNFSAVGTAGQTAIGTCNSTNFQLSQGFILGGGGAPYLCGDADGNGMVNISDAVYLIAYIFGGGDPPDPLLSGDADCNQLVNISDAVYLIGYIFGGGPEPCDPDDDGVPDC